MEVKHPSGGHSYSHLEENLPLLWTQHPDHSWLHRSDTQLEKKFMFSFASGLRGSIMPNSVQTGNRMIKWTHQGKWMTWFQLESKQDELIATDRSKWRAMKFCWEGDKIIPSAEHPRILEPIMKHGYCAASVLLRGQGTYILLGFSETWAVTVVCPYDKCSVVDMICTSLPLIKRRELYNPQ